LGLKENVIVGHLIPAGTGTRAFNDTKVATREELEEVMEAQKLVEASNA